MRIERIRFKNLLNSSKKDRKLPEKDLGVLVFSHEQELDKFARVIQDVFYPIQTTTPPQKQKQQRLIEVWLSEDQPVLKNEEGSKFYLKALVDNEVEVQELISLAVLEDSQGRSLLQTEEAPGELLFGINKEAFHLGCMIRWPKRDSLTIRLENLQRTGDETLSLKKIENSLTIAKKRLADKEEFKQQLKAEYDSLRQEWDKINRCREEERLLQIKLKNLQVAQHELEQKIVTETKIREKLTILKQNPDYRELRKNHGELLRLEELYQEAEETLAQHTKNAEVDWEMITSLREECLAWAEAQENMDRLAKEVNIRLKLLQQAQQFLAKSPYHALPYALGNRLQNVYEEKIAVQAELNNIQGLGEQLEQTEIIFKAELTNLEPYKAFAEITPQEENRLFNKEAKLTRWQSFRGKPVLEGLLQWLGLKGIEERLQEQLKKEFEKYNVTELAEFKARKKEYLKHRDQVEKRRKALEQLKKEAQRELKLRQLIESHTNFLERVKDKVGAESIQKLLDGWLEYQETKATLQEKQKILDHLLEQQEIAKNDLDHQIDLIREKLKTFVTPVEDMENVLEVILKIASALRAKEIAEKDYEEAKKYFNQQLGERNFEQLAEVLEPLAELERETYLSEQEREIRMKEWKETLAAIRQQLQATNRRIKTLQAQPPLEDIEKKLNYVKQRWLSYENLHQALEYTQTLLAKCTEEWQIKYGREMEYIAKEILNQMDYPSGVEVDYFAYRLGVAQLAIGKKQPPLFFFVNTIDENQEFWNYIFSYLQQLASQRQVIIVTIDEAKDWSKYI